MRKLINENDKDWDEFLAGAVFALNTNVSTTTKFSPFFLMFGRDPVLPLEAEVLNKEAGQDLVNNTSEEMVDHRIQTLKNIHDKVFPQVSTNIKTSQEKQKIQYENKKNIPCPYKVGDLVLRRNMLQKTSKGHKMEDNWLGPFTIVKLTTNGTCTIKNINTGHVLKRNVPMKQLKKYQSLSVSTSEPRDPVVNTKPSSNQSQQPRDPVVNTKPSSNQSQQPRDPVVNTKPSSNQSQQPRDPVVNTKPSFNESQQPRDPVVNTKPSSNQSQQPRDPVVNTKPSFNESQQPRDPVVNTKPSSNQSQQPRDPVVNTKPSSNQSQQPSDPPVNAKPSFNPKQMITNLTSQAISKLFQTKIIKDLTDICSMKVGSWRMDILKNRSSDHSCLKKKDLALNVHFGCFTDHQTDAVVELIHKHFPNQDIDIVSKVLFPEALILICSTVSGLTYKEAEQYLLETKQDQQPLRSKRKRRISSTGHGKKHKTSKTGTAIDTVTDETLLEEDPTFSPIRQGIPSPLHGKFQTSFPAFKTTKDADILVEMIVNGTITFEGNQLIDDSDLKALAGYSTNDHEKWLTNFVIDEYLHIIKSHGDQRVEIIKWEEFDKVPIEHFLKNKENLLEQDMVFIPMNSSHHWVLGVILPQAKSVVLLDSKAKGKLEDISFTRVARIMSILDQADPSFDYSNWSFFVNGPDDIPQQNNYFDCGVFLCMFARCIATGCALIEQHTIPAFRKLMVLELHQTVLYSISGHLKAEQIIIQL